MTAAAGVSFLAPAKINLGLRVFGKRADGFHYVRSVMAPVSLYDEVSVMECEGGISVEAHAPGVPEGPSNTCHKAASLFMEWSGVRTGVRIVLRKRIPAQAGLGGGSSDAAATLKGLSALTGRTPPADVLLAMASRIGADVPFFTLGVPALAEGIGERLTPVAWDVPFFAAIVKPAFGLPTGEGYRRLGRAPGDAPPAGPVPSFRRWEDVVAAAGNDFEAAWAGFHPEIERIKRELREGGARVAGLSGSGSAVFGLFDDEGTAREALGALSRRDGREAFLAHNI